MKKKAAAVAAALAASAAVVAGALLTPAPEFKCQPAAAAKSRSECVAIACDPRECAKLPPSKLAPDAGH